MREQDPGEKSSSSVQPESRLDWLLEAWKEAVQRGDAPEPEAFCAGFPEQRVAFLAAISRLDRFDERSTQLQGDNAAPDFIGPYRVLRELGRGGTSTVFLCEQAFPKRPVVVKLFHREAISRRRLRRFQVEAQFLATLSHPGIAHILDASDPSVDPPYIVMDFVEGTQLDEYLCAQRPSVPEILALFLRIADALRHAHKIGVVHRDLTPGNILVGEEAQPRLIDFGIARPSRFVERSRVHDNGNQPGEPLDALASKIVDRHADDPGGHYITDTRVLAGTAPYMSPEQFQEDQGLIGVRSDVYGLAVVLYEAVTGVLPYRVQGKPFFEVAQIVRNASPRRLCGVDGNYERSLNAVLLKALAKEPRDRYQTISEFADDLRRVLDQEPVRAQPVGPISQAILWCRRNPRSAIMAGTLAATITTSAIVSTYLARVASSRSRQLEATVVELKGEQARSSELMKTIEVRNDELEDSNDSLFHANDQLRRTAFNAVLLRASSLIPDDPVLARSLIIDETACPTDLRGIGWHLVEHITRRKLLETRVTRAPVDDVVSVQLAAEGRLMVTVSPQYVRWWETSTGRLVFTLQEAIGLRSRVSVDASGNRALITRDDGGLFLIDRNPLRKTRLHNGDDRRPSSMACASDGQLVAAGMDDGSVLVWDAETGNPTCEVSTGGSGVVETQFSESGELCAVCTKDGRLMVFNARSGQPLLQQQLPSPKVGHASFSPDLRFVCFCPRDRYHVWDTQLETVLAQGAGSRMTRFIGQPERGLLSVTRSHVHRIAPDESEQLIHATDAAVRSIDVSADGTLVAIGCGNGMAYVYRLDPVGARRSLNCTFGAVNDFKFAPQGQSILAAVRKRTGVYQIQLFSPSSGLDELNTVIQRTPFDRSLVQSFAFSPDGESLFVCSVRGLIERYDLRTESKAVLQHLVKKRVSDLLVTADGRRLIAGDFNGKTIRVLSAADGRELQVFEGDSSECRALFFGPDSSKLYSAHVNGVVCKFDLRAGKREWLFDSGVRALREVVSTPNGDELIISPSRGNPSVWKVAAAGLSLITELPSQSSRGTSLDVSPDGSMLVTGDQTGRVVLWDAETWQPQVNLPHSYAAIVCVRFTPDGSSLIVSGNSPDFTLWNTTSPEIDSITQ